jgi:hypothetical protein
MISKMMWKGLTHGTSFRDRSIEQRKSFGTSILSLNSYMFCMGFQLGFSPYGTNLECRSWDLMYSRP